MNAVNKYLLAVFSLSLLLACSIPNLISPWQSFNHELLASLAFLLLFLFCLINASLCLSPTGLVLLLVSTIPFVQFSLGSIFFLGDAMLSTAYLLGATAIFASVSGLSDTVKTKVLATTLWIFFIVGLLNSFLVLYQYFQLDYLAVWVLEVPVGRRPIANLGQPK